MENAFCRQNSLKMAQGLSPCLVRIGGKGTNILQFGKEFMKDNNTISGKNLLTFYKTFNTFTESLEKRKK